MTLTETIATPIVKDKFWVVEQSGNKIGTIQAVEEGGFVYVYDQHREKFPSIKAIKDRYNITVTTKKKEIVKPKKEISENEIYGYPTEHTPHSSVYNLKKKLPIYSRTPKSKSYHCAGYYLIKYNNVWVKEFCPKLILLNRHDFLGPWATAAEQEKVFMELS